MWTVFVILSVGLFIGINEFLCNATILSILDLSFPLHTIPYQGIRIKIFKDSNNSLSAPYFYSPACSVIPNLTEVHFNNGTSSHYATFKLKLWDSDLDKHVKESISKELTNSNETVNSLPLPFSNIRFNLGDHGHSHNIVKHWISIGNHPEIVAGRIRCTTEILCIDIANSIKTEQFATDLTVLFALQSTIPRRLVSQDVRMPHLSGSATYTAVTSKLPRRDFICLKLDDFYDMMQEISLEIADAAVEADEFVEDNEINKLINRLSLMLRHNISSTADLPNHWEDVFWRAENERPDRQALMFTEMFSHNKLALQMILRSSAPDNTNDSALNHSQDIQDLVRAIRNSKNIQWTGERFIVKNMQVHCLNLSSLTDKESFGKVKVRVSGSKEDYSTIANLLATHYGNPEAVMVGKLEQALSDINFLKDKTGQTAEHVAQMTVDLERLKGTTTRLASDLDSLSKLPIGSIVAFYRSYPPSCWLECNGQSFSSSSYPQLYSVLSSSYVPYLSGQFLLGRSSSYGIGNSGGEARHTLSNGEMPMHNHGIDGGSTSFLTYTFNTNKYEATGMNWKGDGTGGYKVFKQIDSDGSGLSHNNMPPYRAVLYIIRAC